MIIQNNAIFIADAHYNRKRTQFKEILLKILSEEIATKQIFLMGDMFDFLSGDIEYFQKINKEVTSLINDLSTTHEIIYLEGNHDFNLIDIFPTLNIIKREDQPYIASYDGKKIFLAHGDIFTPFAYNFYSSIIRNRNFMKFINFIDKNYFLSKYVEEKLINKKICHIQNNFLGFVHNRIINYHTIEKIDLIIEGHFHQGYLSDRYINLPSLACDNRYMIYKNNQFSFNTL